MPIIRFQLTPDMSANNNIDSSKISAILQQAGIDCEVQVNHSDGTVEIRHGSSIVSLSVKPADLPAAKVTAIKNFIRSMPQYQSDLP